jgi:hypothetical protein
MWMLPVAVLACLAVAAPARGQTAFLASEVANAQLRAKYFSSDFQAPSGQTWSVQDHLVHVYRATIAEGTITIGATLAANTPPRAAMPPASQQSLSLTHVWGTTPAAIQYGSASQTLSVQLPITWSKGSTIFSYPLFLAYDVAVGSLSARCGAASGCPIRHTIVVLPSRAAVAIGGVERPVPTLLSRQTTYVDLTSAGISPFAEWESISLDGAALTKVPFMTNYATPPAGQWYRHPVRAGDPLQSGDPLPPTDLVIPSSNESLEKFLSCGGGGCGTHQARIGFGQGVLAPGLHQLRLRTRPYASGTYSFYQTEADVGAGLADDSSDLTTDFILFGPQMQVAPAEAGPNQVVTVTGSGFAPHSQVRIKAIVNSRNAQLGMAETDVTGSFEAHPALPPAGDVFFEDVIEYGPRTGAIQVDVDDQAFLDAYFGGVPQYANAPITFVPVATETTTTTLSTPTTTLPGEPGDVGLDDTPACTAMPVPEKAVQKFDSADQNLDIVEQMIVEAATRKAIRKVIGKADKALGAARRLVNRARKQGLIPDSCAAAAFDLIDGMRERGREAKQTLKGL